MGNISRSVLVLLTLGSLFAQRPEAPAKLSVLIVDGVNNHDWETATRELKAILLATGRFRVDVATSPTAQTSREDWEKWKPRFSGYDAVLLNFNGGHQENGLRWPRELEQSLESYLSSGGGLIVFHAANNAFLKWDLYNEWIGLGWRPKTFGPGLVVSKDERVVRVPQGEGLNPGHGPRHDFQVSVLDAAHPITHGLPKRWLHPSEQLTHGQHGPAKGLTILTYAWSKDSKQNEPMDWVRTWGKGRIYTTMLGHTWKNEANPNMLSVGFQTLFARGVEWAASGRVTIPVPANFPGPER
jgi:hypothetical protein